jgi:hypothetical protein
LAEHLKLSQTPMNFNLVKLEDLNAEICLSAFPGRKKNNDFSIDLSNIKYIDKIFVKNSIYQVDVDKPYAIKELSLNKFLDPQ